MPDLPPVQNLSLTPELAALVNAALADGAPVLLAAVSAEGKPVLSFRGSLQTYSDTQLGLWVRRVGGDTLQAIAANPNVACVYRNGATRAMFQFHGRARIASDPAERSKVFEAAPEFERKADPERTGVAVVIDLDRVEGLFGFGPEGPIGFTRMARVG